MKDYLILVPILGLFAVGLFIVLRSGRGDLTTRDGRRGVMDNLSSLFLRIMGYLAGLAAVHQLAGIPVQVPW